ncbi:MAG: hypothetical protein GQ535_03610 [Rhodobacteraceae bacterium]|nr:hypothetical protein [Paracoccaceae bacterium]
MQLNEHFGAVNGNSSSERERLQRQFVQQRELQERQDKKAKQAEDDFSDFIAVAASQEQVDAARERVADDDISEAELEALDADLLDGMPPSVRSHVAGLEPPVVAVQNTPEENDQAADTLEHAQNAVAPSSILVSTR